MRKQKTPQIRGNQKPLRTTKGPEPERLKIEGNWIQAVDKSLAVKRPPTGWPK
jgi:hypothetical protein